MSEIHVKSNESLESALRRFKRQTARDGILAEARKREHYEKPSVKRKKKAEAARALCGDSDAVILAADTMVFLDGLRLGKPHSEAEAFQMLSALSGREHLVCTGVTMCRGDRLETRPETTAVRFASLSEEDIRRYIATGEPMDKAGAYGIQGLAALFVTGIAGDYFNVMGLPLHLVGEMLRSFGVELLSGRAEP